MIFHARTLALMQTLGRNFGIISDFPCPGTRSDADSGQETWDD